MRNSRLVPRGPKPFSMFSFDFVVQFLSYWYAFSFFFLVCVFVFLRPIQETRSHFSFPRFLVIDPKDVDWSTSLIGVMRSKCRVLSFSWAYCSVVPPPSPPPFPPRALFCADFCVCLFFFSRPLRSMFEGKGEIAVLVGCLVRFRGNVTRQRPQPHRRFSAVSVRMIAVHRA